MDVSTVAPATTRTVLLVDDDDDIRMCLRVLLSVTPGFSVVGEASSALDALEQLTELQPDIVVLDHRMPGLRGLGVVPVLRRTLPAVRLVVYSGSESGVMAAQALAAGADAFVGKGATPEELLDRLAALFEDVA